MDKIEEFLKIKLYESKSTKKAYRYHINNYFTVVGYPMDTYFDDKSLKEIEMDLIKFWEYLVDTNKAPMTKNVKISSLRVFMTHYNKEIKSLDVWDTFTNRLKGKNRPVSKEIVPDKNQVKNILNHCNVMVKTSVIMALSSGMRIGEIVRLLHEDLFLDEIPARVNIRAEITKTGVRRTTFISSETTELLNEWLRLRDDYVKTSIKTLNFKNLLYNKFEKENDKRIFPCEPQVIRRQFNRACNKCGYTDSTTMNGDIGKKKERRSLHFHNLRKYFRTNFGNADLSEELMGHSGYLSQYRNWSDKQLGELYLKYQHNVLIYETSQNLTELQDGMIEKEHQIKDMLKEIDIMKQEIHILKSDAKQRDMEIRIDKLENDKNQL